MTSDILRLPGGGSQATWTASAVVYTEVTGIMYGLQMRPLADPDAQNFLNLQTDVDNIPSVFLSRIVLLIIAKRH